MAASLNCFLHILNAEGESFQKGYETWVELQSWEWEAEAESSWTKGSGASVGKAVPGKMSWEHYWDKASAVLVKNIVSGTTFEKMELRMCKSTGKETPEWYWRALMDGCLITKVNQSATDEGNVTQKIEMVFKKITFEYKPQDNKKGNLGPMSTTHWDISKGSWG